ncbi:MAG: ATP-binding protein [Bacteroidales bacterium]|nr:ATP-binding protein [Bacteroidales bacterium]
MMVDDVYAQNNDYRIDDELYKLYVIGEDNYEEPLALVIADSLMREAYKRGDNKAVCLSHALKIRYLMQEKFGLDTVMVEVSRMKEVASRLNEPNYRYYASLLEVKKMLSVGDDMGAFHSLIKLNNDARVDNSALGRYSSHLMLGDIYANRRNYTMALQEYETAQSFAMDSHVVPLPVATICKISRCQIELGRYEDALESINQISGETRMSPLHAINLASIKCISEFMLGRIEEFRKSYQEYEETSKISHDIQDIERRVVTMNMLANNMAEDAIVYANTYTTGIQRYSMLANIYHHIGEEEKAFRNIYEARKNLLDLLDKIFSRDIKKLSSTIESDLLYKKAKDLELERNHYELSNYELEQQQNQLKLENARLDIEHQKAVLDLQKTLVENRDLELSNQDLQINQQKIELERQNEQIMHDQRKIRRTETVWILVATIFGFFVVILIVYYLLRERDFRRLAKLNASLLEAQKQAQEMQRVAEESEAQKTNFIQSMSHEIRTPLNAICGFSQILADSDIRSSLSSEEKGNIGDVISNNTDALISIVNDILYISDIKSGKYKMSLSEVSAVDICKTALAGVIDKKTDGVELNFATNVASDFKITTDFNRVHQVLDNFLSNAIKHTKRGEICLYCIVTDEHPDSIVFSVSDTGEGVPPEKAEEIFDSFIKLDEFKPGTGLGLSICRLIAEKLGGSVSLDKEYKEGARFVFVHPLVAVVPNEEERKEAGV